MNKYPIPFCSFGGYRRFCRSWWKDLWRWVSHGWFSDLYAYWHRARYGWASRDTWSLDHYLAGVLAGSLWHLGEHSHGAPGGYPQREATFDVESKWLGETNFALWEADLKRWSQAFADFNRDDYYELHGTNYTAWHADEERRGAAMHAALVEMEPWFEALWD